MKRSLCSRLLWRRSGWAVLQLVTLLWEWERLVKTLNQHCWHCSLLIQQAIERRIVVREKEPESCRDRSPACVKACLELRKQTQHEYGNMLLHNRVYVNNYERASCYVERRAGSIAVELRSEDHAGATVLDHPVCGSLSGESLHLWHGRETWQRLAKGWSIVAQYWLLPLRLISYRGLDASVCLSPERIEEESQERRHCGGFALHHLDRSWNMDAGSVVQSPECC